MAKITYLLGAGASYNACPILDKQAEMMMKIAEFELDKIFREIDPVKYAYGVALTFTNEEYSKIASDNKSQILWHIGYFGKKALEYNTIDTYAKKLHLNRETDELKKLKMCVSVFFDLWENFHEERYSHFSNDVNLPLEKKTIPSIFPKYQRIDNRYKSLFSILLERNNNNEIKLNNDFKFISWNYDLQLEETFKLFIKNGKFIKNEELNDLFKFKEIQKNKIDNDVFHLNGHRGFYNVKSGDTENRFTSFEEYWENNKILYNALTEGETNFDNYIKYSWEHSNDDFSNKVHSVLSETEILVIIGYSFPAFNRRIDQNMFDSLVPDKVKKIVYQDPNATKELILNLFKNPNLFKNKIEVLNNEKSLTQFYLPNDFFITQENKETIFETTEDELKKINY